MDRQQPLTVVHETGRGPRCSDCAETCRRRCPAVAQAAGTVVAGRRGLFWPENSPEAAAPLRSSSLNFWPKSRRKSMPPAVHHCLVDCRPSPQAFVRPSPPVITRSRCNLLPMFGRSKPPAAPSPLPPAVQHRRRPLLPHCRSSPEESTSFCSTCCPGSPPRSSPSTAHRHPLSPTTGCSSSNAKNHRELLLIAGPMAAFAGHSLLNSFSDYHRANLLLPSFSSSSVAQSRPSPPIHHHCCRPTPSKPPCRSPLFIDVEPPTITRCPPFTAVPTVLPLVTVPCPLVSRTAILILIGQE